MAITTDRACGARLSRSGAARFDVRGLRVVLALAALLACWAFAEHRHGDAMLSLAELERAETVLMSCDRQPVGVSDHLWCEAPNSPLCLPALPASGHIELWDHPPCALLFNPPPEALIGQWVTWPRPEPATRPRSRAGARLERPPRV
jgi:hypothetical protein